MSKPKIQVIQDGTHDRQSGVYENYNGKADWLAKTIERMAEDGYKVQQRLPDVGLTIFELVEVTE